MYCPKCGKEQTVEKIRFCVGCGFALEEVAEALERGGAISHRLEVSKKELKMATIKGTSIMTLGGLFLLISLIIGTPEPSYFVQFNLLVGILAFLFGLGLIAYSFWIKPRRLLDAESARLETLEEKRRGQLAESDPSDLADFVPADSGLETNDLAKVHSVTEPTTKHLKIDRD